MPALQDKVALVTGASRGIGKAIAAGFSRECAKVVICGRKQAALDEVAAELGGHVLPVACHVGRADELRNLVETAHRAFGRIDVLVNNAAFQMAHQGIEDLPDEEIERTFRTNIFGMFYLTKAAWPHLQAGATIINTASIEAVQPNPSLLAYASTKAAIVNFTKGLAQEAAQKGIRVNAVAPGPIWTPLIPATMPEEQVKSFGKQTPLQRPGQPAELAPAYVYLASQESSYVTAAIIPVTGGEPF